MPRLRQVTYFFLGTAIYSAVPYLLAYWIVQIFEPRQASWFYGFAVGCGATICAIRTNWAEVGDGPLFGRNRSVGSIKKPRL